MQTFVFLYGLCLPFTSAFALSAWVNLPVLIGTIIFFFILIKGKYSFNQFDVILFILFVLPIFFSAIVNIEYSFEEKYVNHILSYLFAYFVYYFVSKELLRNHIVPFLNGIIYGLVISLLFEFIEFFIAQSPFADILNIIPRFAVQQYQPLFHGVVRARSVVEESGHYALYLGIIGSLYLSFFKSNLLKIALILGVLLTFSTSGIYFGIVSVFFAEILSKGTDLNKKIFFLMLTAFIFSIIFFYLINFHQINLINLYTDKQSTLGGRKDFFLLSLNYFINSGFLNLTFGLGPGYYDYLNLPSVISLPALILFQTGMTGLIMYVIIIIICFKRVKYFHRSRQPFFIFSICFSFLVYNGISNYWYPWIWVLFATLSVVPNIDKSLRKNA